MLIEVLVEHQSRNYTRVELHTYLVELLVDKNQLINAIFVFHLEL